MTKHVPELVGVDLPPLTHYQAETAVRHLVRRVPVASADATVGEILASLPGRIFDAVDGVYIVDREHRLQGVIRLRDLLHMPSEQPVAKAITGKPPMVHANEDQERMASLAIKHSLAAVPVVDDAGRLLGVVPARSLIRILRREHMEDLQRLAGIHAQQAQVHEAFEASPAHRLRDRFPWLAIGLVGSMIATAIMAHFEAVLEARVTVAFFVPAIVYLADAIGTQTEAIAVRFLSLEQAPLHRLLVGELAAGLLIGVSLAAVIFPAVLLGFNDLPLAIAVAAAVVAAGGSAATMGLVFPWLLARAGKDPALGSGPVATILQDVLSILIYFGFVLWLVV
jgi:magnesium transporter